MNHTHSVTDPGHYHTFWGDNNAKGWESLGYKDNWSGSGDGGGRHMKTDNGVPIKTGISIDTHTGNTGNIGFSTAFNIMPPYIIKYCFERIS